MLTLDRPLEGVENLAEVGAHRGLGALAVVGLQGVEDRLVLAQRPLVRPGRSAVWY